MEKKKQITIEPITRLEGEAKIEIFLDDDGNVDDAFFQVVELRGFEKFCEGRPVEEMPRITPRICGVCPAAHHMASTKACDAVFGVDPPEPAKKLRELFYCAHHIYDKIAHFFALAGPDFVVGPDADPARRNVLGLIEKAGMEAGKEVFKHWGYARKILEMIGGKATHPVCGLPGGMSKPIGEDERKEIEEMAKSCIEFSNFTLKLVDDVILANKDYVDLITGDTYYHETYYMGMVDANDKVNFYEGDIKVVDPEGKEYVRFAPRDYLDHIEEHVNPWSYLKFPYLKNVGWKGLVDGKESGIYRVNCLARLNVADGMATPLAQEAYEKMYQILGGKPAHATLAYNWARVIELMYSSERLLELARDKDIISKDIRAIPTGTPSEGVGCVEAPRGTLYHHYWTDENGIITRANLIVATGQNNGPMCMSIKRAAQKLIKNWNVNQGLLNMVEMAFRAYDPCLACATHALPGRMPLEVNIYDPEHNLIKKLTRG
jgi:F420-non-reducing hydrogenase large subunit